MTVAVIDGDSHVYRCGFAAEKTYYLVTFHPEENPASIMIYGEYDSAKEAKKFQTEGTTLWTHKEYEPLDHCLATVKNSLTKIKDILKADELVIFLSGKGNFREKIYPDYKANRATMAKPKYYKEIREYLIDHQAARVVDGCEADDAVAIEALARKDSYIVTQDKDLQQIPGKHYNWVTGAFTTVNPEQGMRFFYEQALSGDPTDNVPGLPGYGPKKAQAVIASAKTPRELAEVVYHTYAGALGHSPDSEVDLTASLVWIWRKPEDKHPLWRHLGKANV